MATLTYKKLTASLLVMGVLTMVACGGGGGSSAGSVTLSGVAASGAAFAGGTITVTDAGGHVVGTSSTVGTDGSFSITLSAGAVAPFVLTATRTDAEGASESLVSVVPSGAGGSVNISPVTNLIAARLSASGDPLKLAAEVASGASTVNTSTVAAKVTEVKTILAPILTATGTTASDPLTSTFVADGTGYDRLLDSIKVTITPASATSSNIEVGLKVLQSADSTQPLTTQFSSSTTTPPAVPTLGSASLLPAGTTTSIQQLLAQLTACYALPLSTRVPSGSVASSITASACTSAFFHNDPTLFVNNGNVVGLGKAFDSMFQNGATGLTFSQGAYEFSRANGDIVASYKAMDAAGNQTLDTFVLRADATDGNKLKLIGNGYAYSGGVVPYQQLREFLPKSSDAYYSTGYDLRVPLINAPAVISHVDVTAPDGSTVLQLIRGSDSMVLPKADGITPSGTTFVRLSSEYASDPGVESTTAISAIETGLVFAPTGFTEGQILSIPNQSVWTFKYYSGATGIGNGILQATQYYKTRTRAATIAELRTQVWANLSAATLTDIQSRTVANGGTVSTYASLPASNNVTPTWVVPTGALPPSQIKLFGKGRYYNGATVAFTITAPATTYTTGGITYTSNFANFNDGQPVGTTTRTAAISCVDGAVDANNIGESHCNPGAPGYRSNARANGLHLWARDTTGREYAHFYATYSLH